mgnify:CR=1 FL=1
MSQPDSIELFAADLRRLRLKAGSPTLAHLQSRTGISKSALSDAFAGKQLPSGRTVDAIANACEAEPGPLLDRRDALALRRVAPTSDITVPADKPRAPRGAAVSRGTAIGLAAASFVGGAAVCASVIALVTPLTATSTSAGATDPATDAAPAITVRTGEDPALTPCVDDAAVATGDTRADNSLLEIVWSDKCQAGWGRITRYDGLGNGNTVSIAIYPQTSPDGPDRQEATEHDVQGAYTTLVVRPTPDTLLCAEGSFTIDGKRIDLGDPLCI